MNNTSVTERGRESNSARPANGEAAAIQIEVVNFKPFEKNTLRGFLDLKIPGIGLLIVGCTLHEKGESRWIGLPGRPYEENGERKWAAILDFTSKDARTGFLKAAIEAVDRFQSREGGR